MMQKYPTPTEMKKAYERAHPRPIPPTETKLNADREMVITKLRRAQSEGHAGVIVHITLFVDSTNMASIAQLVAWVESNFHPVDESIANGDIIYYWDRHYNDKPVAWYRVVSTQVEPTENGVQQILLETSNGVKVLKPRYAYVGSIDMWTPN